MSAVSVVDAHVHLWLETRADDILILKHQPELGPQASPDRLRQHLMDNSITDAILVQSAPTKAHSDWMIEEAAHIAGISGIIGWIDPFADDAGHELNRLAANEQVCGIRLMLNRMEHPERLLDHAPLSILSRLADHAMTLECLAPPHLLPFVARLAEKLSPGLIVLDHCGLPPVDAMSNQVWLDGIKAVAAQKNISTKVSGLIEPYPVMPTVEKIAPVFDRVMQFFGPSRLMMASNFPVVNSRANAAQWSAMSEELLRPFNLNYGEREQIRSQTAMDWHPRMLRYISVQQEGCS